MAQAATLTGTVAAVAYVETVTIFWACIFLLAMRIASVSCAELGMSFVLSPTNASIGACVASKNVTLHRQVAQLPVPGNMLRAWPSPSLPLAPCTQEAMGDHDPALLAPQPGKRETCPLRTPQVLQPSRKRIPAGG